MATSTLILIGVPAMLLFVTLVYVIGSAIEVRMGRHASFRAAIRHNTRPTGQTYYLIDTRR